MTVQELRIGNWVYYDGRNTPIKEPTDLIDVDEFKPIPLTEEILLKCGFENERLKATSFTDIRVNRNLEVILEMFCDADYSFKHVKHLHQLQNLYFSLVGKELEVKL